MSDAKPIAFVTGYHNGYPVVQPTDGAAAMMPVGMALYAHTAPDVQPVAWIKNLTYPQPHAVTDLQYCSVAQHERGDHLQYVPLYTHQPAAADVAELVEALLKTTKHIEAMMAHIEDKPERFKAYCLQQAIDARAALEKWEGK